MSNIILLTGVTGYVGRELLGSLCSQDCRVRLVLRRGKKINLNALSNIEKVIYTENIFLETVDWWCDALKDVETVIHCAWYAEPGQYQNSQKNLECLKGTIDLGVAAIRSGVKKIVGIGTCFEYDLSQDKALSISSKLNPTSLYAAAKLSAYFILRELLKGSNVQFLWCRLFYIYGGDEDPRRLAPYVKNQLINNKKVFISNPNAIRDYMPVGCVASEIVSASLGEDVGVRNICSASPISIRQFTENIAQKLNGDLRLLVFGSDSDVDNFEPRIVVGIK